MNFFVRGLDEKKKLSKGGRNKTLSDFNHNWYLQFNFLNLKTRRLVVSVRLSDWYLF